jgi:4-aminobutyrate aminotransferase-like enzyme
MRTWATNPLAGITLVGGGGCTVRDASGKTYLDLLSGTWCNVLGYGHPRWVRAVEAQASGLVHAGAPFATPEVEAALAKLREILPPALDRAVLLNTGSEAVELALKMARAATGSDAIVVIEGGYYGATTYALGLSEAGRAAPYLPRLGPVHRVPAPHCSRCPAGRSDCSDGAFPCLSRLEALAAEGRRDVAAVLWEPVVSGAGVLVPPRGWAARLRELGARCGALLVAEEVTTGVGRTGRWFGFEHGGLVPDLLVVGKAIGAGLPVSAVVTTSDVEARCSGALAHVQSHQNDPFSGRIAATVLSILQEERLVERAAARGAEMLAALETVRARRPAVAEVRGLGAMAGVELAVERAGKGAEIAGRLLDRGFIVNWQPATRSFRLFPPYVIASAEIAAFVEAFDDVMRDV